MQYDTDIVPAPSLKGGRMRTCQTLIFIFFSVALSGCASFMQPQNAEEFRTRVPESYIERVDIQRPYVAVANTIKKKAPECLDIAVRKEGTEYNGPYSFKKKWTTRYVSTIRVSSTKAELNLQFDVIPRPKPDLQNTPPEGLYIMSITVTPVNKDTTRLVIYGGTHQWKTIPQAVKNWATGTNMGCPDLSSI
jgi:hypothetical protein